MPSWPAVLLVALVCLPSPTAAVTIFRIGGEGLPPPADAGQPGVEFRQLAWSDIGDNGEIARLVALDRGLGPVKRGQLTGSYLRKHNPSLGALFDQMPLECGVCGVLVAQPYNCVRSCSGRYGSQGTINIDLGDRLFVERVVVKSGDANRLGIVEDFAIHLSPVPLSSSAGPQTPFTAEVFGNQERIVEVGGFPEAQRTVAIQLALSEHEQPLYIGEVFIYAKGTAGDAAYTSDILDFGQPAVWGGMRWALVPAPESRVSVTTRSGDQLELLRYWRYTGIGGQKLEVTREEYSRLGTFVKAGTTVDYDSWSAWAPQSDLEGALAPTLPSKPRRALQLQLRFETAGPEGSQLEYVEVRASLPCVSAAVGEIEPMQVDPGVITDFTYTMKPSLAPADLGFDHLEIRTVAARFEAVQSVSVDDFEVPFNVVAVEDDRLLVSFPRVGVEFTDALVEVRFQARVLRYGAAFAAQLFDSDRPQDPPQPVIAGDAVDEVFSDRVWIETSIRVRSVLAASAAPVVFTPNGDGVNDETHIAYDLFETTGGVPVRTTVHDLIGRRVRLLHEDEETIGHYERPWDGRDDDGRRLPPGVYLYRVRALVGGRQATRVGVVHLAY